MRRTITRIFAVLAVAFPATAIGSSSPADPLDVGSCYSPRPICLMPQVPLCICDITQNCFWVCK